MLVIFECPNVVWNGGRALAKGEEVANRGSGGQAKGNGSNSKIGVESVDDGCWTGAMAWSWGVSVVFTADFDDEALAGWLELEERPAWMRIWSLESFLGLTEPG